MDKHGDLHPQKTNTSLKKGTILIGNTSEPTIDFQGTAVSFPGSNRHTIFSHKSLVMIWLVRDPN